LLDNGDVKCSNYMKREILPGNTGIDGTIIVPS